MKIEEFFRTNSGCCKNWRISILIAINRRIWWLRLWLQMHYLSFYSLIISFFRYSFLGHYFMECPTWVVGGPSFEVFIFLRECSSFLFFLFLVWVVRSWLSSSSISSSFSINQASSYVHSSTSELPYRTKSLNEIFPWNWETIQGCHLHFLFFDTVSNSF